jgi:hypothetical protein
MREQKQREGEEEDRRRKKVLADKREEMRRFLAQQLRDKEVGFLLNFRCYFPTNARCSRSSSDTKNLIGSTLERLALFASK